MSITIKDWLKLHWVNCKNFYLDVDIYKNKPSTDNFVSMCIIHSERKLKDILDSIPIDVQDSKINSVTFRNGQGSHTMICEICIK